MNEVTSAILKFYRNLKNKETVEPVTINTYVFPNINGIQGIKEYEGIVNYKQKHTRVKHRYKIRCGQ